MKQKSKKKNAKKRSAAIALLLVVALIFTGTWAWQSLRQTALNEYLNVANPGGRLHDDFNGKIASKGETNFDDTIKHIYVENFTDKNDGAPVVARIMIREYLEFGDGAGKNLDSNDREGVNVIYDSAVASAVMPKAWDVTTWQVHDWATTSTKPIRQYFNLVTGGQTVYMPTFNKNKDSWNSDINGTLWAKESDGLDRKVYSDDVEYRSTDVTSIAAEDRYTNFRKYGIAGYQKKTTGLPTMTTKIRTTGTPALYYGTVTNSALYSDLNLPDTISSASEITVKDTKVVGGATQHLSGGPLTPTEQTTLLGLFYDLVAQPNNTDNENYGDGGIGYNAAGAITYLVDNEVYDVDDDSDEYLQSNGAPIAIDKATDPVKYDLYAFNNHNFARVLGWEYDSSLDPVPQAELESIGGVVDGKYTEKAANVRIKTVQDQTDADGNVATEPRAAQNGNNVPLMVRKLNSAGNQIHLDGTYDGYTVIAAGDDAGKFVDKYGYQLDYKYVYRNNNRVKFDPAADPAVTTPQAFLAKDENKAYALSGYKMTVETDPEDATVKYFVPDYTQPLQVAGGSDEVAHYLVETEQKPLSSSTSGVRHNAKPTLNCDAIMPIAQYLSTNLDAATGKLKANAPAMWVYDTDGWAYWTGAIQPQNATGLLIKAIQKQTDDLDSQRYYYAMDVLAQFASLDDIGNAHGSGFYDPTHQEGLSSVAPSADAEKLLKGLGGTIVDAGKLADGAHSATTAGAVTDDATTANLTQLSGEKIVAKSAASGLTYEIPTSSAAPVDKTTIKIDLRDESGKSVPSPAISSIKWAVTGCSFSDGTAESTEFKPTLANLPASGGSLQVEAKVVTKMMKYKYEKEHPDDPNCTNLTPLSYTFTVNIVDAN